MSGARRSGSGEPQPDEESEKQTDVPELVRLHPAKRVLLGAAGGLLVLIGVALLVLPGPGLLLVLAGLILLSRAIPAVARYVEPVRERALQGAEAGVASPWRIAGTALAGLGLIAAGVICGLRALSWLPFTGWSTGSSLILSGLIIFALLIWSYRRVHSRHP
ncbi:hypothetical protein OG552_33110 [Streptomyces sp. NBC_01476]|uniref:PGPGW domain-containing protein n=1 Tax=Streptomyces sp. NBC_01476 TaxID=2903881 RepID=UPI002E33D28E|nr:PGPGW domain-containing protein [Streptomyces sp. NBC_01476]